MVLNGALRGGIEAVPTLTLIDDAADTSGCTQRDCSVEDEADSELDNIGGKWAANDGKIPAIGLRCRGGGGA